MRSSPLTVVMTACIDPSAGSIKVHRRDRLQRLQDYRQALEFWLSLRDPRLNRIVFIDNSGHPLDDLESAVREANPHGKDLAFISTKANYYPAGTHYGYAELGMVDHVLSSADRLVRSSAFIKATGRLGFPGVTRLLDRLPENFAFAVDARRNRWLVKSPQHFVTTQLMIFATDFYRRELLGIRGDMPAIAHGIEELFYKKLMPFEGQKGCLLRWPVSVGITGFAAHWAGKRYDTRRQRLASLARDTCRILVPSWWV